MHTGEAVPRVYEDMLMKDVIMEVTSKRLGAAGVFNRDEELVGIITDGDLRRALERYDNMLRERAATVMAPNPKGDQERRACGFSHEENGRVFHNLPFCL